jgi:RNA recognition motif-containing protein
MFEYFVLSDSVLNGRRFAFVEFSKSADADLAVSKFNGYEWEKQKIYVGKVC